MQINKDVFYQKYTYYIFTPYKMTSVYSSSSLQLWNPISAAFSFEKVK